MLENILNLLKGTITFIFYLNDKREISNFDKKNLEKLKNQLLTKTNDLLMIYSNNHLSIKKNKTLIDFQ